MPDNFKNVPRAYKYFREAHSPYGVPKNGGYYKKLMDAINIAKEFLNEKGYESKIYRREFNANDKEIGKKLIMEIK